MFRRIVEKSGRPLSFSLAQSHAAPDSYKLLLGALHDAVDAGLPMKAQVSTRAVGVLFGLDLTVNPFSTYETYKLIANLSVDQQVAKLRDADFRARLFAETPNPRDTFAGANLSNWAGMYPLDPENPDYEPKADHTVAALAASRGVAPLPVSPRRRGSRGRCPLAGRCGAAPRPKNPRLKQGKRCSARPRA